MCLSDRSVAYCHPRLWSDCLASHVMGSPPLTKMVVSCGTYFIVERLLHFAGLIFILAHVISSSMHLFGDVPDTVRDMEKLHAKVYKHIGKV